MPRPFNNFSKISYIALPLFIKNNSTQRNKTLDYLVRTC
nr:MAG TPA: hypothetical protein [Bacteriophage sp.]DAU47376.1 MAG TPA: hypothetical protein [Caudoviricetes sp.]